MTLDFFHNQKPVWEARDPGFSIRVGINFSRRAVSLYLMFGSNEHWFGIGWWR